MAVVSCSQFRWPSTLSAFFFSSPSRSTFVLHSSMNFPMFLYSLYVLSFFLLSLFLFGALKFQRITKKRELTKNGQPYKTAGDKTEMSTTISRPTFVGER